MVFVCNLKFHVNEFYRLCPIFQVSNVVGTNLDLLRAFLNLIPLRRKLALENPAEFQIDDVYWVDGVGTIVSGTCLAGMFSVISLHFMAVHFSFCLEIVTHKAYFVTKFFATHSLQLCSWRYLLSLPSFTFVLHFPGSISSNDVLLIGPDPYGEFAAVSIKSIHRKRMPVTKIRCGQTASLAIRYIKA